MKIAYSHLLTRINEKPTIEKLSNDLFQLGHEHEIEGNVFNMEFTPNRGDCLSINGLLRDLSVFYTVNPVNEIYNENINSFKFDFENAAKNICTNISFLKIEVDSIPNEYLGPLKNYFSDLNISRNNFFTDVSNFISYETGQPTHCYDANKIFGKIIFQEIENDVEFETLLGKKINLTKTNSVFTQGEEVINLAGVIGGKNSSCSSDTKTAIIECAYFQPEAIIGKSIKYDIQSEASHKFERGVDSKCHDAILRRFIKIISEHTNIKNIAIYTESNKNEPPNEISFDANKINKILGNYVSETDCISYLSKLGFMIKDKSIKIPSFRHDIFNLNDIAEEVGRVIGYDNIPRKDFFIPSSNFKSNESIENKLRYFLLDHGFYEVINPPFLDKKCKKAITVDNPLDSNRKYLRTDISSSLIKNMLTNERRQKDSIKLFEISDIYSVSNGINRERKLSLIASGRVGLNYEDFNKKIDKNYLLSIFSEISSEHILNFNTISRQELDTKIKSEIVSLEINLEKISNDILSYQSESESPKTFIEYKPISDLPSSFKDISYSVKDYISLQRLQKLLLNYKNDILQKIFIFDYFYNMKSHEIKIGFRFIFQSEKSTLTAAEIDVVYSKILKDSLNITGVEIPGLN